MRFLFIHCHCEEAEDGDRPSSADEAIPFFS
jgi:hypothetical protein